MSEISVQHISKSYGDNHVLDDVSFTVPSGKITVVLGKNGAGKTTLIKLMLNMISAGSGDILYDGISVKKLGYRLYRQISAVLESVDNLYPFLSGRQNLKYFLDLAQSHKSYADASIQSLLSDFDLIEHMDKPVGEYSRGMLQKLALVIALANDGATLFLDEPTLGLDFQSTRQICEKIKRYSSVDGRTIVLTSHQSEIIDLLADYVILIDGGKVIFEGAYQDFLHVNARQMPLFEAVLTEEVALFEVPAGVKVGVQDGKTALWSARAGALYNVLLSRGLMDKLEILRRKGSSIEETLAYFYTKRDD